ncbi:MAG: DUF3786 domain-containing protein [Deltaproteobacteria bacterium]|jgi:hypothetical protein|nr:DUF3786 domain-containing protein [Deltaproteobacteria bacterium]
MPQFCDKNGYLNIYNWVIESLPGYDLTENAKALGLKPLPGGAVVVPLLSREYLVDSSGVKALDEEHSDVNSLSIAAHYAMSRGRGLPSMSFASLFSMSGLSAGSGQGSFDRDAVSKPLAKRFASDLDGLNRAVTRLGGRKEPQLKKGTISYVLFALPRIPIKIVFNQADEDFEDEFSLLYDSRTLDFMEFEAVAFLGGLVVTELLKEPV